MSHLSTTRGFRIINAILRRTYQAGKSVSFRVLQRLFGTLLNSNPEKPIHSPKAVKTVDDINSQLTDVHFDMDVLMNEVQFHINSLMERVSGAEVVRAVSMQKVRELSALVDRMNVLSANTTFIDVLSFDPTDPNFVDRAETTAGLDSDAGVVTLRRSRTGTKRHKITGVSTTQNINILEDRTPLRTAVVPGSMVANIFNDTLSSWQYEVVTRRNNDLTVDFDFQINSGVGIHVNKIVGRFPTSGTVRVLTSTDAQNWFSFGNPQRSEGVTLVWSAKTTLVNYVRVQIIKDGPDSTTVFEGAEANSYVYGIESLAFFDTGYEQQSTYQTVALKAAGGLEFRQASLEVDVEPMANTQIDFELAAGNQSPLVFRPIKPTNLPDNVLSDRKIASIIDFSKSFTENRDLRIRPDTITPELSFLESGSAVKVYTDGKSIANQTSHNAKHPDYQALNHAIRTWRIEAADLRLNPNDDVRNAKLHVGVDGWLKTSREVQTTERVTDVYVELIESEGIPLFRTISEIIDVGSSPTQQIPASRNILNSINVKLTPSTGTSNRDVFASVLSIIELGNASVISGVRVENVPDPNTGQTTQFLAIPAASADVFLAGQSQARVKDVGFFKIEVDANDDKRAKVVQKLAGDGILVTGLTYEVTVGARDITTQVDSLSGNKIVLKSATQASGKVEIIYNSPFTSQEVVSASTIRVTSATDPNIEFTAGRDFSFLNNQLFVSKNTRITKVAASNFNPGADTYPIRLSYSITIRSDGLDQYTTWVKVTSQDPVEFEFANLSLDDAIGERASVDAFDLTTEKKLILSPGWHRISVLSKPFTIEKPNAESAISKVVTLRSVEGVPLLASGRVFSHQRALFDPLNKVGQFELSRSTKQNDMTVFGMDSENNVYLNFHPGKDSRIFVMTVTAADGLAKPLGSRTAEELAEIGRLPYIRYRIIFDRMPPSQDPVTEVVLRAILRRSATSSGDVTPTLKRVKLKAV